MRGMRQPTKAIIYALCDPDSGDIRYIGKTHTSLKKRFHLHLSSARRGNKTPKALWIKHILSSGKRPTMIALEEVNYSDWPEAEARWMKIAYKSGCDLLNVKGAGGGP
jgi:hypothetical protein